MENAPTLDPSAPGKWKSIFRQCFLTASVAFNIIGHGCVMGFPAVLIPNLREPDSDIQVTPAEESWIASVVGFALIAGNITIMLLMDTIGRKKSHFATILPVLVGWYLFLLVNNVAGLIAVRFLQGIPMGMLGCLGSIIIGEMTDPKYRGMFLTCVSLSLTIGVLFVHTLGVFFKWRHIAIISSVATFTSFVLIFFTKESPSWLIAKERFDEAKQIFFWMRGFGPDQERELESMITAKSLARKSSIAGMNLPFRKRLRHYFRYFVRAWKKPEFYKPIIIMILMYITFQFAGINVISSYATDIISQVVGEEANAELLMVALDIERLIGNLFAVFLMRTLKRRTLLFASGSVCVLTYFGKATYVYLRQHNKLPYENQWIPIVLISMYMFSLTIGIVPIPFALSGELFPLEYRGLGSGLSILGLSVNFFLAVKCFPVLTAEIGLPLTYIIYASVVTVCLSVVWFMLPETKDKTLQEIEDHFKGLSSGRRSRARNRSDDMRRVSSIIMY